MLNGQEKSMKVLVTDVEQTLDFRFYDDASIAPSKSTDSKPVSNGRSVRLDDLLNLQNK